MEWNNVFGIYRTPVAEALKRPVYEAPDIDVLGPYIDATRWAKQLDDLKRKLPDAASRCRYLDLSLELDALFEYSAWISDMKNNSGWVDDEEREDFYDGLIREVAVDHAAVRLEREFDPATRIAGPLNKFQSRGYEATPPSRLPTEIIASYSTSKQTSRATLDPTQSTSPPRRSEAVDSESSYDALPVL